MVLLAKKVDSHYPKFYPKKNPFTHQKMQKITPCLWFDNQAEEAAKFYVSVFKDAKILNTSYYEGKEVEKVSGMKEGTVLTVLFELNGEKIMALNGGPIFHFSEAVSLMIDCKDQEEVDYFWSKLTADGGEESQCGWLKDKFGFSWQVVPSVMDKLMKSDNPKKSEAAMNAMLKMKKLDINALQEAYDKA
jgi:predicted 3-demethylubiquinone-9 3-methyltransferase (glyoxalase superfamily)